MYNPWYIVLWRLLWAVPTYLALALYSVCLFVGFGKNPIRTWEDCL